jgi:saccharopepsin
MKTPFENMVAQKLVDEPMFAFYLTDKNSSAPSEMTFGGYDRSKYTGNINWVPLVRKGYWEVVLQEATVGEITIASSTSKATAVLDTGTSLIAVPTRIAERINKEIGTFHVPLPVLKELRLFRCNKKLPTVTFTMGGVTYSLDGPEYSMEVGLFGLCISAFQGMDLPGNIWILGDTFLRKYYTVYDYGHGGRVGIARAV